jgi:DNA ligase-1
VVLSEGCPKYAQDGKKVFELRREGPVLSCTCPEWSSQKAPPERRTCGHLKEMLGAKEEARRIAAPPPVKGRPPFAVPGPAPEDPSGWTWTERIVGIRAWWDGSHLVAADGRTLTLPKAFTDDFPTFPVDGDVWDPSSKDGPPSLDGWKDLRFSAVDAPHPSEPLEQRLARLEDAWRASKSWHLDVRLHDVLRDGEHLRSILSRLRARRSFGLLLRRPGSRYSRGEGPDLGAVRIEPREWED